MFTKDTLICYICIQNMPNDFKDSRINAGTEFKRH